MTLTAKINFISTRVAREHWAVNSSAAFHLTFPFNKRIRSDCVYWSCDAIKTRRVVDKKRYWRCDCIAWCHSVNRVIRVRLFWASNLISHLPELYYSIDDTSGTNCDAVNRATLFSLQSRQTNSNCHALPQLFARFCGVMQSIFSSLVYVGNSITFWAFVEIRLHETEKFSIIKLLTSRW